MPADSSKMYVGQGLRFALLFAVCGLSHVVCAVQSSGMLGTCVYRGLIAGLLAAWPELAFMLSLNPINMENFEQENIPMEAEQRNHASSKSGSWWKRLKLAVLPAMGLRRKDKRMDTIPSGSSDYHSSHRKPDRHISEGKCMHVLAIIVLNCVLAAVHAAKAVRLIGCNLAHRLVGCNTAVPVCMLCTAC